MTMRLYLNGERLNPPAVFAVDHLGYGVFETLLARKVRHENSAYQVVIVGLSLHLERLQEGCSLLGIDCPPPQSLRQLIFQALKEFEWLESAALRIRLVVLPERWFLQLENYNLPPSSIDLRSVEMQREVPHVKSCSALVSALSQKEAQRLGANEALLIDRDSTVRETSWGNFFWIDKSGQIYTTKSRILPGITRKIVFDLAEGLAEIIELDIGLDQLKNSMSGAFVTRSTAGLIAIGALDHIELNSIHNDLFMKLSQRYDKLYQTKDRRYCDCIGL